jgi:hypothetical protein
LQNTLPLLEKKKKKGSYQDPDSIPGEWTAQRSRGQSPLASPNASKARLTRAWCEQWGRVVEQGRQSQIKQNPLGHRLESRLYIILFYFLISFIKTKFIYHKITDFKYAN